MLAVTALVAGACSAGEASEASEEAGTSSGTAAASTGASTPTTGDSQGTSATDLSTVGTDASETGDAPDPETSTTGSGTTELVAVTLNTHSFQEGESSLDKLTLIGQGLATLEANIVGLNEVMSGTLWSYDYGGAQHDGTELIVQAAEEATGVPWHAATFEFAHWDTGETMSNVVLSRAPILDMDSRALTTTDFWPAPNEQRSVGYVRTEIEPIGAVAVFVTHAWGWDSTDTEAQIAEVKAFMAEKTKGDERLVLLLGDLNTPDSYPAYGSWIAPRPALVDTFVAANPGTVDGATIFGEPHRVDYVLHQAGTDATIEDSELVFDGRRFPVVSDHKGVATTFSFAG